MLYFKINETYPLFRYATCYWFTHIRKPKDVLDRLDLLDHILGVKGQKIPYWMKLLPLLLKLPNSPIPRTLPDIALTFDIPWLLELAVHRDLSKYGNIFSERFILKAPNKVMTLLLNHSKDWNLEVTTKAVKHVLADLEVEVLQVLLNNCREVKMTEEMVKVAVSCPNSEAALCLILDKRGKEVKITEEVLKAAARNHSRVLGVLLDRRGKEVEITEAVLRTAVRGWGNTVRIILNQRREEVKVTEEVMKDAANNYMHGVEILNLLLELRAAKFLVTDDVIKSAATSGCESNLVLLEKRCHANINTQHPSTCQLFYLAKSGILSPWRSTQVDVDIRDIHNRSLLSWSAQGGHASIVQLLLDRKVEFDVRCSVRYRPDTNYVGCVVWIFTYRGTTIEGWSRLHP